MTWDALGLQNQTEPLAYSKLTQILDMDPLK